jgi:hypothetical protein
MKVRLKQLAKPGLGVKSLTPMPGPDVLTRLSLIVTSCETSMPMP